MRMVAIALLFIPSLALAQDASRLDLPLHERLEQPQRVAAAKMRLTDLVSFIAISFKVPVLVETTSPVPDLSISAGTYNVRQLLDSVMPQLHGFAWRDEKGVVHVYKRRLLNSRGNIMNVRIHRFTFPRNVAEFLYFFRPCIRNTVQGYECGVGAFSGLLPLDLHRERLPSETFRDVSARDILLSALKANGRFYVLIAFESDTPKLKSEFPYLNWFSQSLVSNDPSAIWVQNPTRPGQIVRDVSAHHEQSRGSSASSSAH
jgi:hypothetical protein